ncbi:MAG: hypothetical protein R2911_10945 [Caldilineaceae bacterium]
MKRQFARSTIMAVAMAALLAYVFMAPAPVFAGGATQIGGTGFPASAAECADAQGNGRLCHPNDRSQAVTTALSRPPNARPAVPT